MSRCTSEFLPTLVRCVTLDNVTRKSQAQNCRSNRLVTQSWSVVSTLHWMASRGASPLHLLDLYERAKLSWLQHGRSLRDQFRKDRIS
jgi:transcriptional regulator GlxA family with amidase domain